MKQLPTAQEAREQASQLQSERAKQQLSNIIDLIHEAVEKEEFRIWFYKPLIRSVKKILEEKGYQIHQQTDRNELLVTISW